LAKVSVYSIILEVLAIFFGAVLIIIGSVMYTPIDDGAFFYIIVLGGVVLALLGTILFIVDMVRIQRQRKEDAEEEDDEEEEEIELEMAEE
jgi:TRAP-type C4-dicarboxylate transport system permease small subunit